MADTPRDPRPSAGWWMPRIGSFDLAGLAAALGLLGADPCRARRQGRCEDRDGCADCAWSEDAANGRR